jgi:hypothetical protein
MEVMFDYYQMNSLKYLDAVNTITGLIAFLCHGLHAISDE